MMNFALKVIMYSHHQKADSEHIPARLHGKNADFLLKCLHSELKMFDFVLTSLATMDSAVLVCAGHALLKVGARTVSPAAQHLSIERSALAPGRTPGEKYSALEQQHDAPPTGPRSAQTTLSRGWWFSRGTRALGWLLVALSVALNVALIGRRSDATLDAESRSIDREDDALGAIFGPICEFSAIVRPNSDTFRLVWALLLSFVGLIFRLNRGVLSGVLLSWLHPG